jgi:hypothetical protein
MVLLRCRYLGAGVRSAGSTALAALLTVQAGTLVAASHDIENLLPPEIGRVPGLQLRCLIEDLALFAAQVSDLLQETVVALSSSLLQATTDVPWVAYGPLLRRAVALLRRAEGWLEAVDRVTGARATLPGFQPGALSLERQLAMQ